MFASFTYGAAGPVGAHPVSRGFPAVGLGAELRIVGDVPGGITLQAQDTRLSLQQSGSSDGKAQLAVGDSSVTIEQSGDIKIEASGTLTLKASKIELNGDASVKIAGQTVELN